MLLCPFQHKNEGARRQAAAEDGQGANVDSGFVLGVADVEMRRNVVVPEHLDYESVKQRDGRHLECWAFGISNLGFASEGVLGRPVAM